MRGSKNSVPVISHSFRYTFETCWSNEPQAHFFLSIQFSRERLLIWFCMKKNLNIGLYSDIYRSLSFKLGMKIETTTHNIFILVWWPWPSFMVTVEWETNNFGVYFVGKLTVDLDEIQSVATTCCSACSSKLLLDVFCTIEYMGEKSADLIYWNRCLRLSCVRTLDNWFF